MKSTATIILAVWLCAPSWASIAREAQKELGINDTAWQVLKDEERKISWLVEPGVVVSLMVHQGYRKDLPLQDHKPELYAYYRNEALGYKGGLVEVDLRNKSGVGFNLVTMKFRLRDMSEEMKNSLGWAYQINAVIPTHDRTYVVQVAAIEQGITGVREAAVTVIGSAKEEAKEDSEFMKNFRRDPYDQKYDDNALFTVSDERRWDSGFPTHPLTRIRIYADKIIEDCSLSSSIVSGALYKNSGR